MLTSAQVEKRTKRNLAIFTITVLGLAVLARVIDPYTIPPDAEPGAQGVGQLLWLVSPLLVALLLRIFGGDGWADLGLRPENKYLGLPRYHWAGVGGLAFAVHFCFLEIFDAGTVGVLRTAFTVGNDQPKRCLR